jgi:hypothetical protein
MQYPSGGPLPASALSRTDVEELRALLVREKELLVAQDRASGSLRALEQARATVIAIDDGAAAADFYRGLPSRRERLEKLSQRIGDAVAEQAAVAAGLLATRKDIARGRKHLAAAFWKEARSRAAQSDELHRQAEQLSIEMDRLEAEASELGLGLHHNYGHCDPIALGGWQYFRTPCAVHPDGRRTLTAGKSEYRQERSRKIELGLLEAAS